MNHFMTKLATFLIALFVVVFAGYHTIRHFQTGYKTEAAFYYEVPRFCDTKGLFIRTEEELTNRPGGFVRYLVEEGQRFRNITPIAKVYTVQEQVDSAVARDAIQRELEVLYKAKKAADSTHVVDIQQLGSSLNAAVREYSILIAHREFEDAEASRLRLVELLSRKQLIGDGVGPLEEHIAQLEAQVAESDPGEPVYSAQGGYFSRYVDGYEREITPDILPTLDCASLTELVGQDYPFVQGSFGKSVTNHNWYYAAVVKVDDIEKFVVGNPVSLIFMGGTGQELTAVVHQVIKENGEALVVLRSDYISSEMISHRVANVRIGFIDYGGLRIPKEALRIVDGKKGVYIKSNSMVRFKQIEIVYTGEDFYLTKIQEGSETFLNLFEEVIVSGKDLYDGKLIDL